MASSISTTGLSALLSQAHALHQQGNLPEASANYQLALDADPGNFDALLGLGTIKVRLSGYAEAVPLLKKAAAIRERHFATHYNLAKAHHYLGQHDQALPSIDKALSIDPDDAGAHNLRGMVLKELMRYEDALTSCNRAIELKPDFAEAYCNRGNVLGSLKRVESALADYDKAIALQPDYIEAYFKQGIALQHLQRYEEALAAYDEAIALDSEYGDAHFNRGLILYTMHKYEEALVSLDRAIEINPDHANTYNIRASALQFLKRYTEALTSLEHAIELNPRYAEVHYNRGNILQHLKRYEEALASYDRAIALKPDYCDAHYNRGIALSFLNRHQDAATSFERAIALKPDYAEAHNNRGNNLQQLKRYQEALNSYEQAISLKPDYIEAHNNRGITLQQLRRFEEALSSYDHAIALKSDFAEAYNNRGTILKTLKRFEGAFNSFSQAITLKPDYADAHINRGIIFLDLQRYDEALANFDKAISLNPDNAKAYFNRGVTFNCMFRFKDALIDFNRVISLDTHFPYAHGYRLAAQMHIGLWIEFDQHVHDLIELIDQGIMATVPFVLLAIPAPPKTVRKFTERYVAENYLPAPKTMWNGERYQHERIRLGYFSAEFRDHSTAYLIAELIEKHDRSRFEIYAFSFGTGKPDKMRARLTQAFDHFHDVSRQSDLEIASLARKLEIDIAIDLIGFTGNSRTEIFALRPAPVQINYHTYSATMGAPFIDYVIADPVAIPKEDFDYYTEKVVHLPNSYVINPPRPIAKANPPRSAMGLPETGFVFCCFNNPYKITPDVFTIWMRLLNKVAGSVLWLIGPGDNTVVKENLHREAQNRGIAPERIIFAPRISTMEHLARHRLADLYLDTFYHGAGTTCSDALWAGLPVLTCAGGILAGRVAASLLHAIDLPELITQNHEEYESSALHLATNPDALTAIRHKLERNRETLPLFDTALFARHIEAAFTAMWRRSQQGLAPDHIRIAP